LLKFGGEFRLFIIWSFNLAVFQLEEFLVRNVLRLEASLFSEKFMRSVRISQVSPSA
jgi:hypothetical protein